MMSDVSDHEGEEGSSQLLRNELEKIEDFKLIAQAEAKSEYIVEKREGTIKQLISRKYETLLIERLRVLKEEIKWMRKEYDKRCSSAMTDLRWSVSLFLTNHLQSCKEPQSFHISNSFRRSVDQLLEDRKEQAAVDISIMNDITESMKTLKVQNREFPDRISNMNMLKQDMDDCFKTLNGLHEELDKISAITDERKKSILPSKIAKMEELIFLRHQQKTKARKSQIFAESRENVSKLHSEVEALRQSLTVKETLCDELRTQRNAKFRKLEDALNVQDPTVKNIENSGNEIYEQLQACKHGQNSLTASLKANETFRVSDEVLQLEDKSKQLDVLILEKSKLLSEMREMQSEAYALKEQALKAEGEENARKQIRLQELETKQKELEMRIDHVGVGPASEDNDCWSSTLSSTDDKFSNRCYAFLSSEKTRKLVNILEESRLSSLDAVQENMQNFNQLIESWKAILGFFGSSSTSFLNADDLNNPLENIFGKPSREELLAVLKVLDAQVGAKTEEIEAVLQNDGLHMWQCMEGVNELRFLWQSFVASGNGFQDLLRSAVEDAENFFGKIRAFEQVLDQPESCNVEPTNCSRAEWKSDSDVEEYSIAREKKLKDLRELRKTLSGFLNGVEENCLTAKLQFLTNGLLEKIASAELDLEQRNSQRRTLLVQIASEMERRQSLTNEKADRQNLCNDKFSQICAIKDGMRHLLENTRFLDAYDLNLEAVLSHDSPMFPNIDLMAVSSKQRQVSSDLKTELRKMILEKESNLKNLEAERNELFNSKESSDLQIEECCRKLEKLRSQLQLEKSKSLQSEVDQSRLNALTLKELQEEEKELKASSSSFSRKIMRINKQLAVKQRKLLEAKEAVKEKESDAKKKSELMQSVKQREARIKELKRSMEKAETLVKLMLEESSAAGSNSLQPAEAAAGGDTSWLKEEIERLKKQKVASHEAAHQETPILDASSAATAPTRRKRSASEGYSFRALFASDTSMDSVAEPPAAAAATTTTADKQLPAAEQVTSSTSVNQRGKVQRKEFARKKAPGFWDAVDPVEDSDLELPSPSVSDSIYFVNPDDPIQGGEEDPLGGESLSCEGSLYSLEK
ncbi:unnamed protein product [Notodromas monacha]|uniref:Uncharacterized protein n=1 Tax=Notodromas monacha TaxID=399045 RepID=A0A7R9BPK5_9CRUS|nr:unnamed protein product [Notodromas monacha]CAG0919068.1 unnamed protein product [Notodromas monacha]